MSEIFNRIRVSTTTRKKVDKIFDKLLLKSLIKNDKTIRK